MTDSYPIFEPVSGPRRCALFFPATRPDRLAKAGEVGVDAVCIDLEDAVPPDEKEEGRDALLQLLRDREPVPAELLVRINSPRSEAGLRDLVALCDSEFAPDGLVIPKVGSAEEVLWVEETVGSRHPELFWVAQIETAQGVRRASEIALASQRVGALLFGGVDLSLELGSARSWEALLHGRSALVHASALARIDAIDMPFLDVSDPDGLAREAGRVRELGFVGKVAIHPSQVEAIQEAFSPSQEEVERARMIVAAAAEERGKTILLDGKMVDQPVIKAAERTLAIAHAMENARTGD